MKKLVQVALLALLLVAFAVPTLNAKDGECWEGIICAVPWNPSNCVPFVFVDCVACEITVQAP